MLPEEADKTSEVYTHYYRNLVFDLSTGSLNNLSKHKDDSNSGCAVLNDRTTDTLQITKDVEGKFIAYFELLLRHVASGNEKTTKYLVVTNVTGTNISVRHLSNGTAAAHWTATFGLNM